MSVKGKETVGGLIEDKGEDSVKRISDSEDKGEILLNEGYEKKCPEKSGMGQASTHNRDMHERKSPSA